ncbi:MULTISPECIES: HAMP domain-containing sensor histidine kinase [Pontibacillus]|uniref:histidine kinase n=1 Tax=Pontibacillus chungwhensis TaxID=265426 RepID=A0ABY8V3Z6_9BACI|nr:MULTISPECIES: HAMP domain-containing sensor histidine kinase [Pontibacillus]MCD5322450.1 HAMP domain-containing histidine kinase [Pontibacillus sp. HN14]WIF99736.1 HAMP domain-containing sensor histidine kinase [Pontibacillus chungwhensis]
MKKQKKKQTSSSLLRRYILILLIGITLFQITLPLLFVVFEVGFNQFGWTEPNHYRGDKLEAMWHEQAEDLSVEEVPQALEEVHKNYPNASLFWIDQQGRFKDPIQVEEGLYPEVWSVPQTVEFMKESFDGDPFTTVAYIGSTKMDGFMVFQISREYLDSPLSRVESEYRFWFTGIGLGSIFLTFLILSLLFFLRLRRRLIHLQQAMTMDEGAMIPNPVEVKKRDEIGLLEESFNNMVYKLKESQRNEQEEESLRRDLIANLSHDLRTPLTTLRGQIYGLQKEVTTEKGNQLIALADGKITFLGELIENLQSYTLLSAHRFPHHPKEIELTALTRQSLASWYDTLENEGFQIDIHVTDHPMYTTLDPTWFQRILDNVIQNVLRHASEGKYIQFTLAHSDNYGHLSVADHGKGMEQNSSSTKGSGIGLTIISLMTQKSDIAWEIESSPSGTIQHFTFHVNEKRS